MLRDGFDSLASPKNGRAMAIAGRFCVSIPSMAALGGGSRSA
jgi:hypothetical protein